MTLSAAETLAIGASGLWCVRNAQSMIPRPILAGLTLALCVWLARWFHVDIVFDTVLRDLAMLTFFTTVGLRASVTLLRRQGAKVGLCLALGLAGAMVQNATGIGLARALGLHPLTGVMAGAVTLAGGPATALAFGQTFEQAGLPDAAAIGLACAVFGILASGLLSAGLGEFLVRRYGLRSQGETAQVTATRQGGVTPTIGWLVVALGAGSLLSRMIPVPLPGYIGAMIVAAGIRYFDDQRGRALDEATLDAVSRWSVEIFIVLALLTLKLWVLVDLAVPLLLILSAQVLVTALMTVAVVWRVLGRGYDAAVSAAGWAGFMLGTTANAVAAIGALEHRHGPSPVARLTVPVVGAFLIDFTNSFVILTSADLVRRYLLN